MTVKDMHIEIEQSTQQVAANRGRKFLAEEIDWILNKQQDRFISSCLRPRQDGSGGFELDQSKTDHIRALITRSNLTAYIDGTDRYKCFLPPDYSHLLSDWSTTVDLCGGDLPAPATQTQYITRLRQELSVNGTPAPPPPPYYATLVLTMPDVTVSIPVDLPLGHNFTGYPEKSDIFSFLVPWILWKGKVLYWERFDDPYYPSSYIAVKTSVFGGSVAVVVDGVAHTNEIVTTRQLTYDTGTGRQRSNRLSASNIIPTLNQSVNWRSSHFSPVSELQGRNLYIYRDDSFIVTGVGISYIRKPQPISLSLNSDCELAGEETHQLICDLATEYIKGTVQNAEGKGLKTEDITSRVTI